MVEFRFCSGFLWKALSLEGGYWIALYDSDLPEQHLSTTMHGPYVALNAVWRF